MHRLNDILMFYTLGLFSSGNEELYLSCDGPAVLDAPIVFTGE